MAVVAGVVHGVGGSAALFLPGRVLPDAGRGSANAALHCLRLPHSTKARNCRPHLRRLVSVPVFDRLLSSRSIVMSVSVCGGGRFVCPRAYLQNYTSNLHQIFVHVTYGRGLVLLWCLSCFCFFVFLCFTDCSCGCVFFQ